MNFIIQYSVCKVDMKKGNKKIVVRLNRTVLYCAVISCIVGIVASVLMFFILPGDKNHAEETNVMFGQIIFACCGILLIFATLYCVSRWGITVSFNELTVRYYRLFHGTYVRPYKYYRYVHYGYKAKTGNLIADSRKTYYIVITSMIIDENELKHVDKIETSHRTIKLLFSEDLCKELYSVFPESHKKMLAKAILDIRKDSKML